MQGAEPLAVLSSGYLGELDCVARVAVVFDCLELRLGGWERAGGAGRDRPESRMPGRLAARRASGPPQAGRLEPVKKL